LRCRNSISNSLKRKRNCRFNNLPTSDCSRFWQSDPRLVPRQDVDIAYSKFEEAKANVDQLRAMASYTRIVAPFDGVITERLVDPGALIHAGGQQSATAPMQGPARPGGTAAPVVSVARLDKLRIYVYVPQAEVQFVHVGMPATVKVQGFDNAHFSGAVTRYAHSLDLATRTMLTEVDLENLKHRLFAGMYANVTLVLEKDADALRLPVRAVGGDRSHTVLSQGTGGWRRSRLIPELLMGVTSRSLLESPPGIWSFRPSAPL
jgi:multidrug efflux pump subunit AcrA (membrane-fusion protein)